MRAFISTSKLKAVVASAALLGVLLQPALEGVARADKDSANPTDRSVQPEDEDFSTTPYTTYGDFNQDKEEEEDTNFFQYGRFFGVSLGVGIETIDGNRGTLYTGGGFPLLDFKLLYWFDFNFALDVGIFFVNHSYSRPQVANIVPASSYGTHSVNIFQVGVDLKYYFDTKNLSAPISFANPFLVLGAGSYTKTDSDNQLSNSDTDTEIGLNFGAGLEFTLSPGHTYLDLQGDVRLVTFNDTYSSDYTYPERLANLTGNFYTFVAKVLFTW
jgi:hypothetical protein